MLLLLQSLTRLAKSRWSVVLATAARSFTIGCGGLSRGLPLPVAGNNNSRLKIKIWIKIIESTSRELQQLDTMPKSLEKTRKKIAKKKTIITALHENSRDSQRLRRAANRDDKISRIASARKKNDQPLSASACGVLCLLLRLIDAS